MSHPHDLADLAIRVLSAAGWSLIGVFIFYFGTWVFDKLDPIDYKVEIEKGNIAAGLKMAGVSIALAAIVVAAIVT